ncbi:hypothetical protein J2W42_006727 [Rhizobium tibeticum]|nr:DUF3307 domain-containing protein [Rhizobium tibeticum]MDP9813851.1 hypothetical protein [Rhizobium tibeticum]
MLALLLLSAHWLCDYPLRGQFLSNAKQSRPIRVYHLIAHSGIQGAGVAVVSGSIWLGLAGWTTHATIGEAKVTGRTTFAQDHALHIACKAVWMLFLVLSAKLSAGSLSLPSWR